ncbi:5'-methylthioadenosine/S-adenosylhomocysteine nucleosidase [Candidatus Bathyarchaeota archaeon]|nr:5'-methylthioadenosine/S-adenosylhomocysteine nucleosidase [Candidatus Bathyarchaeota archaeon]
MGPRVVVIVSADGEWDAIPKMFPDAEYVDTPYGQTMTRMVGGEPVVFFHGGWGKIPSAASVQYAVDRWSPELIVNLGTCGGFAGHVERDEVILVEKAVVYDIINQIGDTATVIKKFTTEIDLGWLVGETPIPVTRATIVSGDRDLIPDEIEGLHRMYGAVVGDWESGGIAWVCRLNDVRLLILRGVSDLVGPDGGEAYDGKRVIWKEAAMRIITRLVESLPDWLAELP